MKIVVDAMGGDFAPIETVAGSVQAAREYGAEIILVGDENAIQSELKKHNVGNLKITIQHASEIIEMGEHPATALRKKKDSSIVVATKLVKDGVGDAVVSAGSTGAAMGAALLGLGRIKGIHRPAIASVLPTTTGATLVLDVGANAESTSQNLCQFAVMGNIYSNKILGVKNPRVGLLNIGEEDSKGNPIYVEANQLLGNLQLNFIGNVEGRDVTNGTADVVVSDGFVGNIVLKFGEGLARDLMSMIKTELTKSFFAKIGALMVLSQMKSLKKKLDYSEYGGAPLLGVNGVSIISHGSSKAKAIKNAIRVAMECVQNDVVGCIQESIQENSDGDD